MALDSALVPLKLARGQPGQVLLFKKTAGCLTVALTRLSKVHGQTRGLLFSFFLKREGWGRKSCALNRVHWPLRAESSIMYQTMYHGPNGHKRVEVGMIIIAHTYSICTRIHTHPSNEWDIILECNCGDEVFF